MKNKKSKKKELSELVSILSNNITIYLVDISNLNSNQISILRKSFNEHSIRMKVVKNTLLKKAINKINNKKWNSFFPILNGNTTVLFSNLNVTNITSKIIKSFHFQEKTEKPYLKGAYAQESFYFDGGNKDLNILLYLKSKEDLMIEIFNILQFSIKEIILSLLNSTYKISEILETLSKK